MIARLFRGQLANGLFVGALKMNFQIDHSPVNVWLAAPFLADCGKDTGLFEGGESQPDDGGIRNGFLGRQSYALDLRKFGPQVFDWLVR